MSHNTKNKNRQILIYSGCVVITVILLISIGIAVLPALVTKNDNAESISKTTDSTNDSGFSGLDQLQQESAGEQKTTDASVAATDEVSSLENDELANSQTAPEAETTISPAIAQATLEEYKVQIGGTCYSLPFTFSQIMDSGVVRKVDNKSVPENEPITLSTVVDHAVIISVGENLYHLKLRSPSDGAPIQDAMVIGVSDTFDTNVSPIYVFQGIHLGMDIADMPECEDKSYAEFSDTTHFNFGDVDSLSGEYAYVKITAKGNVVTDVDIYKNY